MPERQRLRPSHRVEAGGLWEQLWFCDNCGTSPGGSTPGMSVAINLQCPECQHYRCKFCNVESVFSRKMTEMPRARKVQRSFRSRPLAILQKRPFDDARHNKTDKRCTRSLIVSRGEGIKTPADLSHNSGQTPVRLLEHPTTINSSIYIALSKISPPNSPPGLSPSSTEASLDSSISSDSNVTSPTMTNLESDISTPALEESDSDGFVESESEPLTCLLDARLLVVLGYDLELAARLIPRIHDLIQRNFASGGVDVRVVPSQATGTTGTTGQTSGASVIRSSISASSTAKGTELKRLKHKHDSEEDDEEANGNKRSKRHRKRWDPALPRPRGFACPFHRKDPEKYAPTTDIKYRTCIGPGPTELRRIKDHFRLSHRPPQCERCYNIFEDVTQLTEHRRSEPPCTQKGVELKEGVDDGQWQMIKELLKGKRGLSSSEKAQHDIDKWFELWTILFPDTPRPRHPWSDSEETKLALATFHVAALIDTFDRVIELDIERGNLQRDDYVHERYRLAVRQLLETTIAVSSQSPISSPLPALRCNNSSSGLQGFSPGSGVSPNQLLPPSLSPHAVGQSPTGLIRGYSIQDTRPQSRTPQSQMENSTPSATTQNSLAAQWGTPRDFSTPATSSSQGTSAGRNCPSTAGSHVQYETPGYNLDENLSLPLQIEWDEEWEQFQNFESGSTTQQGGGIEPGITSLDSEQDRPSQHLLPENDTFDAFATNQSLTAILALEIDLPTAGAPIKDHRDRNKGLQKPLYDE